MSVEGLQIDSLFGVAVEDWHTLWAEAQRLNVPVRDLPTAIRAAMPCYMTVGRCEFCESDVRCTEARNDVWRFSEDPKLCPSCAAQAEIDGGSVVD